MARSPGAGIERGAARSARRAAPQCGTVADKPPAGGPNVQSGSPRPQLWYNAEKFFLSSPAGGRHVLQGALECTVARTAPAGQSSSLSPRTDSPLAVWSACGHRLGLQARGFSLKFAARFLRRGSRRQTAEGEKCIRLNLLFQHLNRETRSAAVRRAVTDQLQWTPGGATVCLPC
jgi:hypothetical protein